MAFEVNAGEWSDRPSRVLHRNANIVEMTSKSYKQGEDVNNQISSAEAADDETKHAGPY